MTTVLDLGVKTETSAIEFGEYDFDSQTRGGEITMQTWRTVRTGSPQMPISQDEQTTSD